ncbi:hypothetical protein [Rhodopirellula bahusiensis]|uniref:hypothetical protein n=1 Tax=Rhodopirellula bahusiensis TaxID=2014065 RepID=UPI00326375B6
MDTQPNPYFPASGVDAESLDPSHGSSRGRNAAYWFLVACWYFPLAVSFAFFIGSLFDLQAMGFWAIVCWSSGNWKSTDGLKRNLMASCAL